MAEATSEPFIRRFKDLFKRPLTPWDKVTKWAWIFTFAYVPFIVTQIFWDSPAVVRDAMSAGLAVALMIISIWYGGILTDFYSKLTGFGISEVREDRRGADASGNTLWMNRILGSEKTVIVGTLSRGWFVVAHDNLDHLLSANEKVQLDIRLLDPFGKVWRSRIESDQDDHRKFLHEANQVFWNLHELMKTYTQRVSVRLYDSEPISCVIARGAIYLGLYLPRTSRKTVPEFSISSESFLGNKVAESIAKIESAAPRVGVQTLQDYRSIMLKHSTTAPEEYWNDPDVFCDFCKEPRFFPSEVSRRYPNLIDGSRISYRNNHFFVVPSLGPLVEDHVLIVSNRHITSSAKLAPDALGQLSQLMAKFQGKAESEGKGHLFFEHGVPDDGFGHGGCGICHCHIHGLHVPQNYNPVEDLQAFLVAKNYKFEPKQLSSWSDIVQFVERSYICVQAGKTVPSAFVFERGQRIESQLMRQFVAATCPGSSKQWDWRRSSKLPPPEDVDEHAAQRQNAKLEKENRQEEEKKLRSAAQRLRGIFE